MTLSSLVLCLSLVAGWVTDPPEPNNPLRKPLPGFPRIDENFHRDFLKWVQRGNARLEETIEFHEKALPALGYTPETQRKKIAELKEELRKWKLFEQELVRWEKQREENPSWETDLEAIERLEKFWKELWPAVAPM